MGVRRIDLTTDEVEYDSRIAVIPSWRNAEKPDEVPDIDLEEVELDNRVPGLQEITPEPSERERWEPFQWDTEEFQKALEKIRNMTDEERRKLFEINKDKPENQ